MNETIIVHACMSVTVAFHVWYVHDQRVASMHELC